MRNNSTILAIIICLLTFGTASADAAERLFYSEASIKGARSNVDNFKWAQDEKKTILAYADIWANMSDEEVWNFLSEQSVPRAIFASQPPKCPIHGSLEAHGDYAWKTIPEERWKLQCPIGGERWPKNDFEAYYRSGKDGNNIFQASRANRGLLSSPDGSGVDDGSGFVNGDGTRIYFVAYYAYWGIWQQVARAENNAVTMLSQAYLLTGDTKYARKAALLIARAADLYPEMKTHAWSSQGVPTNDGGTGGGKVLGSIWDDDIANNLMLAYDAVKPAIDKDNDLHAFLAKKSGQFGLAPQGSAKEIHAHVHENLLEPIIDAVMDRDIRSNEGRAQRTIAMAGALRGGDTLKEVMEWLEAPGDNFNGGGHLPELFWSLLNRDGTGTEASPYYNGLWLEALMPLAEVLKNAGGEDIFAQYPHLKKLILYPGRLMSMGKFYPHIGDSGGTGTPEMPLPGLIERYVEAYMKFGLDEAALMAYNLNGNSTNDLHGGLFVGDYKKLADKVKELAEKKGATWEKSDNMNAYGLAMHRAGRGQNARTMWMYWGATGHGGNHPHADRLNLGLFAHGLNLLPDLGYPEYAIAWPTTQGWIKNTAAHNTVVVDGKRQAQSAAGDQRVFADTPRVQFSEVDGGNVYPQTSLYRRSVAMIQVDDKNSYMVDLFRVHGGGEHVYSFHAAGAEVDTDGLNLSEQGGTFAGPDVGFGYFYDEPHSGSYAGSGFQYLDKVQTDNAAGDRFTVDWKIMDSYDQLPAEMKDKVRLRMTMLGNEGAVSLANGYPAQNNEHHPRSLRYMLVRNQGSELNSRFLGVIEPYVSEPFVQSTELMPLKEEAGKDTVALKVTLKSGRVDYIFSSLDDKEHTTADGRFTFRGPYAVYGEENGENMFAFLADGGELRVDGDVVAKGDTPSGTVSSIDYDGGNTTTVVLDGAVPDDGSFANRWIDFAPGAEVDANFLVQSVDNNGSSTKVVLTEADPVVGFNQPGEPASGLRHAFEPGAEWRFPAIVYNRGEAYDWLEGELAQTSAGAASQASMVPMGCSTSGGNAAFPLAAFLLPAAWVALRRIGLNR